MNSEGNQDTPSLISWSTQFFIKISIIWFFNLIEVFFLSTNLIEVEENEQKFKKRLTRQSKNPIDSIQTKKCWFFLIKKKLIFVLSKKQVKTEVKACHCGKSQCEGWKKNKVLSAQSILFLYSALLRYLGPNLL